MIEIEVNLNDLPEILGDKVNQLPSQSSRLVLDLTDIAYRWVVIDAPRKTGRLKASGIHKSVNEYDGSVFVSKDSVPYIEWVIDGTGPHEIVPKNKRALFWSGAAYPVKKVRHPGTKSNPFVDKGYDSSQSSINARIEEFADWLEEV